MNKINYGNFVLPKDICPPPKFRVWPRPRIVSISYAELKSHKKDFGIQMVPQLSCLPLLTVHPVRPYGNTACQERKPDQLEELAKIGDVVPSNKPPSQVIADAFKKHKEIPSEAELSDLTAKVFLHPDEVHVWL